LSFKCFTIANRCTYLLVLESTRIYIKIHTKMLQAKVQAPDDGHRPKHVGAF
jgi:hypothetical protein